MEAEQEARTSSAALEASPRVLWDWGTAYDMFISLQVLHSPADFGLRGAWAAGVRSRLPSPERELLEEITTIFHAPLSWIHRLPDPKDADTVLYTIKQIPPRERLVRLFLGPETKPQDREFLLGVAETGSWTDEDRDRIQQKWSEKEGKSVSPKKVEKWLDLWSRVYESGEGFLSALETYHDVFFREEEERIRPKLQAGLTRAREMAGELPVSDLLEELSQGFRFAELPTVEKIVLVPSYWCTPLVIFSDLDDQTLLLTFGARPPQDSLVPGEVVPDALLSALKALADPTRLRILHYLTREQLSPAELARRLRLRPPTVTHHLHALRLAGLVRFTLEDKKGKGDQRSYWAHHDTINAACEALFNFLQQGSVELEAEDPEE